MPQFHLHIRCNGQLIHDGEGFDFDDLSAAAREAVRSIRSLVCGDVQDGKLYLDLAIEIWDGDGHAKTVQFDDAIRTITGGSGSIGESARAPRG